MFKAVTKALNLNLPETLSEWFTEYAKGRRETKTDIIVEFLQKLKDGNVDDSVDNPVDIADLVAKEVDKYLQEHLHAYVEKLVAIDVDNSIDKDVEMLVGSDVDNDVDIDNYVDVSVDVDKVVDSPVDADNDVDDSVDLHDVDAPEKQPIIALTDEIATAKIAYASKLKITYKSNHDGSVMLKSIRGIELNIFKKLSDGELEALGLYRESIGVTTKYWEIQEDRLEGKAIASTEPRENLADKRFTSMAAAAYYKEKSGQPLKVTTLIANAKKYGFVIKERGSGLYALIDP